VGWMDLGEGRTAASFTDTDIGTRGVEGHPCGTARYSPQEIPICLRRTCAGAPPFSTDANDHHNSSSRASHCRVERFTSCLRWLALAGHHQIVRHLYGGCRVCGHHWRLRRVADSTCLCRSRLDERCAATPSPGQERADLGGSAQQSRIFCNAKYSGIDGDMTDQEMSALARDCALAATSMGYGQVVK
jgi:hypothetical protein